MGCDGLRGGRGWRVDGLMGRVGRGCDLRWGVSGRGDGDWVIGKFGGLARRIGDVREDGGE